jgi:hypothetical protein
MYLRASSLLVPAPTRVVDRAAAAPDSRVRNGTARTHGCDNRGV